MTYQERLLIIASEKLPSLPVAQTVRKKVVKKHEDAEQDYRPESDDLDPLEYFW